MQRRPHVTAINPHHIVWKFPEWHGTAEPDSYRDCFGIRTRMRYMPAPYMELAGTTQGKLAPNSIRAGLHDVVEWAGVLLGVLDATDSYTCVELGAGYGPFVVGSGLLAIKKGILKLRLIAVEGDATHVEWMREHFRDNALNPDHHKLICGVVGTYDGTAQFPALTDPATEWGAEAVFDDLAQTGRTPQRSEGLVEKPCYSLATILQGVDRADVVHFDIQGAELNVIRSAIDTLNAKARRLVIGTHGRDLELELMRFLDTHGWSLELDKACTYQQQPPHGITLLQDGVQVWKNARPPT